MDAGAITVSLFARFILFILSHSHCFLFLILSFSHVVFFPVSTMSLQGGALLLRQQVSGSEENHSAAADWTSAALQQSRDGDSHLHCHRFTTRGQSWPTHSPWLQVRLGALFAVFPLLNYVTVGSSDIVQTYTCWLVKKLENIQKTVKNVHNLVYKV